MPSNSLTPNVFSHSSPSCAGKASPADTHKRKPEQSRRCSRRWCSSRRLKITGTPKKIVGLASRKILLIIPGTGFSRHRIVVAPFSSGKEKLLPSPYPKDKPHHENNRLSHQSRNHTHH